MNRRDFLKSLAAIGTSLVIDPSALAKATEPEVEAVWQAAIESPRVFYVNSWGALSSSYGVRCPTSRRELLDLASPGTGKKALLDYLRHEVHAQQHVEYLFDCAKWDGEAGSATCWREWIKNGDDDLISTVEDAIENWLDADANETEWEAADINGMTDRGDAMQFFRWEADTADLFNILIVDGDRPGSSYFAAELRMDVEEANALATEHGIPVRFDHDEY